MLRSKTPELDTLGGLFTIARSMVDLVDLVTLVGLLITFLQPCVFNIVSSFFPSGFEVAVEFAYDTSALRSPTITMFFQVVCALPSISSSLSTKEE